MGELTIRRASTDDADAIDRIYNHYVRTSVATFQVEEKGLAERLEWLAQHGDRHPVLVAERNGEALGWASLSKWGEREAWQNTVESSVWVDPEHTREGIGPALLDALVKEAERIGHHALVAQIVSDNEPSLKMSERAGFERVGVLKEVGFKFGRWLDVVLVERVLD